MKKLLPKAKNLPQRDVTWLCTTRRAPTWITPKHRPPYRPYLVLVLEQETDFIHHTGLKDERPTSEAVFEALLQAMQPALTRRLIQMGKQGRPKRLLVDDLDLAQALKPNLAELDIRCVFQPNLPLIETALHELEAHLNKRDPMPGLLSLPGVTEPMVAELFAAAAEYYRQAPWHWMPSAFPIQVRYSAQAGAGRTRYAVVLGHGGETFGLSFYESQADLGIMYSGLKPPGQVTTFSLAFDEATAMAFKDLDALEKYGWPVAGEQAYPLAIKITPPGTIDLPNASELMWLAAGLRVIPDFVQKHLRAKHGLPRPAQATYALPNVHGDQEIALRYPAASAEAAEDDTRPELAKMAEGAEDMDELEEFIADWYYDEASHQFARQVGGFLFQFVDHLETTGLSRRTLNKHIDNCWSIGYLECGYGYHDTFTPKIFLGGPSYLYEFKRKVGDSKYAVNSYRATWRKLEKYVCSLEESSDIHVDVPPR